MYSFFDTFNLRSQLLAGAAPEDDYLFHLGYDVSLERLLKTRHKLFGWVLVAVGLYTLYDELIMGFLRELYWNSENNWIIRVIYNIMDEVPTVLICLALIALGAWLVRGPQQKKQDPADDPSSPLSSCPASWTRSAATAKRRTKTMTEMHNDKKPPAPPLTPNPQPEPADAPKPPPAGRPKRKSSRSAGWAASPWACA